MLEVSSSVCSFFHFASGRAKVLSTSCGLTLCFALPYTRFPTACSKMKAMTTEKHFLVSRHMVDQLLRMYIMPILICVILPSTPQKDTPVVQK